MKKRLSDVITAQALKAVANSESKQDDQEASNDSDPCELENPVNPTRPEQIRIWLADDKSKLLQSFQSIAKCEQRMEIDNSCPEENGNGSTGAQGKSSSSTHMIISKENLA